MYEWMSQPNGDRRFPDAFRAISTAIQCNKNKRSDEWSQLDERDHHQSCVFYQAAFKVSMPLMSNVVSNERFSSHYNLGDMTSVWMRCKADALPDLPDLPRDARPISLKNSHAPFRCAFSMRTFRCAPFVSMRSPTINWTPCWDAATFFHQVVKCNTSIGTPLSCIQHTSAIHHNHPAPAS